MSSEQREGSQETTTTTVEGNGTIGGNNSHSAVAATLRATSTMASCQRLRLNPNNEHRPDTYEDLQLDFPNSVYSSLEKYLPPNMLVSNRDEKIKFMTDIMLRHLPHGERSRAQRHRDYRQKIISNYQPLHRELYTLVPTVCFVPSFLKAINESTEESFRNIISEPSPGVFVFDMLQPSFCEMMLSEIDNFERWVGETKFRIMRPNTMNKYGAVLDDFGLDTMLDKLMEGFIRPISKLFFSDVGGASLDSHHGFVVEYGKDRDVDLGFHVDDSEVTLNVCLGNQFVGGELFFRGTRCEKHVNTATKADLTFDYDHIPGQAVLHRGRHRHGARATTSGHRVNMLLWCRSSVFRELKTHQKEFSSWCGECFCEKRDEKVRSIDALRKKLFKARHTQA
ncbi:oxidoreductase [Arabidopsis lyrata subsp. lyrata]|uniref:Oxidoreductase n=1 Tax=Arabidopsis lyrata subsp. lyrata TaxID=81972 RepID=D7L810_ARALL|nr:oxidoreductase [Arabidopsis lyrata subsp. lyrata]